MAHSAADSPRLSRRITLVDVARDAGVSPSTVSLVLNQAPRISAATVARVQASIDRLDYQYDGRAAALRSNVSTTASLILDDVRSRNHAELTMAVEQVLCQDGLVLTVGYHHDDPVRQEELLRAAARQRIGGLVLLPAPGTEETPAAQLLARATFPLVTIGRHIRGLNPSYVGTDNRIGARLVGEHLRSVGVRQAALVAGSENSTAFQERMEGFRSVSGLAVVGYPAAVTAQGGVDGLRRALADLGTLDAVVAFSDAPALGIVHELRDTGMEKRIAVVAFDDNPVFALLDRALTCVETFPGRVGGAAAELLRKRMGEIRSEPEIVELVPELRIRSSTRNWKPAAE